MGLAAVRDLREMRGAAGPEEIERFEVEVLGGFVLARSAAGLSDSTIRSDVSNLEQVRTWFGRPLWEMEPVDADAYFGTVLRAVPPNTRLARAQAIKTYFEFVELRHKVEIHNMTGRIPECPIDEMNRPRGRRAARLRIPPSAEQVAQLFGGWRGELATCRGAVRRSLGGERAGIDRGILAAHEPGEASRIGEDGAGEAGLVVELGKPPFGLGGGRAGEVDVLVGVDHREEMLAAGQSLLGLDFGCPAALAARWPTPPGTTGSAPRCLTGCGLLGSRAVITRTSA